MNRKSQFINSRSFSLLSLIILHCSLLIVNLPAQSAVQYLYKFSPLGEIIVRNLGMEDKNGNGVIDKGANEGYENFTVKYGNADIGFHINGITQGANNGKLEEPEITNLYYTAVRFKPVFEKETALIEKEINDYIYANNLPLVWLDDKQGTVMNAVNKILGIGWQNKKMSESEMAKTFQDVTTLMGIKGRPDVPSKNNGYYTLSNFVNQQSGYCFETAQFGFWFFSQLKTASIVAETALTPTIAHAVIKLINSNTIMDYSKTSNRYNIPVNQWANLNPIQSIGEYYHIQARAKNSQPQAEQSLIYNKYDISNAAYLMDISFDNLSSRRNEIIADIIDIGEFILKNVDIQRVMISGDKGINQIKDSFERLLSVLVKSYSAVKNRAGYNKIESILNQYYSDDPKVKPYLDYYRF